MRFVGKLLLSKVSLFTVLSDNMSELIEYRGIGYGFHRSLSKDIFLSKNVRYKTHYIYY